MRKNGPDFCGGAACDGSCGNGLGQPCRQASRCMCGIVGDHTAEDHDRVMYAAERAYRDQENTISAIHASARGSR